MTYLKIFLIDPKQLSNILFWRKINNYYAKYLWEYRYTVSYTRQKKKWTHIKQINILIIENDSDLFYYII